MNFMRLRWQHRLAAYARSVRQFSGRLMEASLFLAISMFWIAMIPTRALAQGIEPARGFWVDASAGVGAVNVPKFMVGSTMGTALIVQAGGTPGDQFEFGGELLAWIEKGTVASGGGFGLLDENITPVIRKDVLIVRRNLSFIVRYRPVIEGPVVLTGGMGSSHYEGRTNDVTDTATPIKVSSTGMGLRFGVALESPVSSHGVLTLHFAVVNQGTNPASRMALFTVGFGYR